MSHPLPTSAPGADATTAAILVETLIYWAARPTRPARSHRSRGGTRATILRLLKMPDGTTTIYTIRVERGLR